MKQVIPIVSPEQAGLRIDRFLAENSEYTRSAVQQWLDAGCVLLNGEIPSKSARLRVGDTLEVSPPEPVACAAVPQEIPLDIVYEDADLLVVNKPKGMVVHPASGHADGTLVNALLAHCGTDLSGINGVMRPGIVHRIDKDTSGLLIVAKNDFAHRGLAAQIKVHSFSRVYETVVVGHLQPPCGTVNAPIGRHPVDRKKMTVTEKNSKPACTHYETLAEYPGYSHMRLRLETGRTHQIRVHMQFLGHPVAGDTVYGGKKPTPGLEGQCLHAKEIGFVHPRTGEWLHFVSDLPPYFTAFLRRISLP